MILFKVGLYLYNLVGFVVGFDKNVDVYVLMVWFGFGFFECGIVML